MKHYMLNVAATAMLVLPTVPALANDDDRGSSRTYSYGQSYRGGHSQLHDNLEHRDFHRDLGHREAHRSPMNRGQHGQLHDSLQHGSFHDRLEHRSYHRDYSPQYGTSQYGTSQYGTSQYRTPQYRTPQYGTRIQSYSPRVRVYPPGTEQYYFQDRYGRQPSIYFRSR